MLGLWFGLVAEGFVCCVLSYFALRCLFVWFRRGLLDHLRFGSCTVHVCLAFLLELTEPAKPVEMPCLRCITRCGQALLFPCGPRCGLLPILPLAGQAVLHCRVSVVSTRYGQAGHSCCCISVAAHVPSSSLPTAGTDQYYQYWKYQA